jgi:hypothetical protein
VLFRPEPTGAELDRLARAAGLHSRPGAVPEAARARTLRLVRALKSMYGIWAEDRADFEDLLYGAAAVDEMWLADPAFQQAGPLTLDLLERVVAAHPEAAEDGLDQETARRVLIAAAEKRAARLGAGLPPARFNESGFVRLPDAMREAAGWMASTGMKGEAVDALQLSGPEEVGEPERSRMFWARVKAGEAMDEAGPHVSELATQVLHLPPYLDLNLPQLIELRQLLTHAFAAGRDASDPDVAATYHLEMHGFYDSTATVTDLAGTEGPGRDLTGTVREAVDLAQIHTSAGLEDAPWKSDLWIPYPVGVEVDSQNPDNLEAAFGGRTVTMPGTEFLEMMANDRVLMGLSPDVPIALYGRGPGMGELAEWLAQYLGRPVWWTDISTDLSRRSAKDLPVLTAQAGTVSGGGWREALPATRAFAVDAPPPVPRPYPQPAPALAGGVRP